MFIKRVAAKQFVLSIAATGSTLMCVSLTYVFHLTQVFAEFDLVMSSLSIILMYQWHTALYQKCVCRKCERCLVREDTINLEMVIVANKEQRAPPMTDATSESRPRSSSVMTKSTTQESDAL